MKTLKCLAIVVLGICFAAMAYSTEKQIITPSEIKGINPQPEPPVERKGINPQPEPPAEKRGINPQPEPPAKSITLPLGTKVEKAGTGYFKLKVPEGQSVEIKGFSRSGGSALIKECRIYDQTGKLIASGKQGVLRSGQKPVEGKIDLSKIDSKGYMKIDDDVTWLPATITFESMKIIDKAGLKGLSP